jgi:hypothetical protein
MEVEGVFWEAIELEQAALARLQKLSVPLRAVVAGELVVRVTDTKVLGDEIDPTIVASPAVGVEYGLWPEASADHGLECDFGGVRDGVDLVASPEQTEDDGLAARSTASFAAHATRTELRLVGLGLTLER